MKLYTFQVPSDARPGRLLALAGRMLPDVPEYILREAFRKRDVKVDGQRAGMDAMLVPGTQVRIYAREVEAKALQIPVIYEDENLIVIHKPVGISCEADVKGGKTIVQLLGEQMGKDLFLCHRLDNPTEGLLLLAKTEEMQMLLQDAFRNRQIHKTYTCLVKGTPQPAHRILQDYLIKDAAKARVRVVTHPSADAKSIVTEYTVIQPGECARLSVALHTGRTHQIRAHMAYAGHPLLGDDQYGDRDFNKRHKTRQLMLCASQLHFSLEGKLAYLNERVFTCTPSF